MRLALLSNVAADVLARELEPFCDVWTPPGFGAWAEAALSAPESFGGFAPDLTALVLDGGFQPCAPSLVRSAIGSIGKAFPDSPAAFYDAGKMFSGDGRFYDARMRELYSMPWSMDGIAVLKDAILFDLGLTAPPLKKVVAVDFDGTLWDGVAGEDGLCGVRPRTSFQRILASLRGGGAVLCGITRNNPSDIDGVWNIPGMVLRQSDFAEIKCGWSDKTRSIEAISAELGLSLDSFVFLDDNPGERIAMKSVHPEVSVPDLPSCEDAACGLLGRIGEICFSGRAATEEDRRRGELYAIEKKRREFSRNLTFEQYLAGLEIKVDVHRMRTDETARVAQLCARSNQFNATTVRRGEGELARMADDPSRLAVAAKVSDKFGDMGLVAFVQARIDGAVAHVEDWLMSCRAMNRRVEFDIERGFEKMLAAAGVAEIRAVWRKTEKNAPAENLFEKFGYNLASVSPEGKSYRKDIGPGGADAQPGLATAS